jgi:hypothetical protein
MLTYQVFLALKQEILLKAGIITSVPLNRLKHYKIRKKAFTSKVPCAVHLMTLLC